ncbi:MAG: hypothetical protein KAH17_05765 [Bacteroidales bacterium]|nr:hypothetical protein [Bacteroidales bacterium]
MKGITNILIVLAWCLDTFMDIRKSKEDDGSIDFKDAPRFIDNITQMPGMIKAAPEILDEALDLDGEEAEEIAKLVIEKTGCHRSEVKLVIRKAMQTAYATSHCVKTGLELAEVVSALKNSTKEIVND